MTMRNVLAEDTLNTLFLDARKHNGWLEVNVPDEKLVELYKLVKMAPTSANCSPGRFLFVKGTEAKKRLKPALSSGNLAKTMAAPVNVIAAYDSEFYEQLPKLFPHRDARSCFTSSPELAEACTIA